MSTYDNSKSGTATVAVTADYRVSTAAEFSYAMSQATASTPIYIEDDFAGVDNPALPGGNRTITIYGQGHTIEQADGGVTAHLDGTGNDLSIYDLTIDGVNGTTTNKNGGGAIYLEGGDVYLEDVTIRDCFVTFATDNVGTDGLKYGGGAVSVALYDLPNKNVSNGSVTAVNCSFTDNHIGHTYDAPGGGALSADQVYLTNCTFWNNRAADSMGGAVYARMGGALTNCTVVNNSAGLSGGGATARTEPVNGAYTTLRMLNCIVVANSTGGTVGKSAVNVDHVYDQGGNIFGYIHTISDADYRDVVYSSNGTRKPADGSVWNVTEGIGDWLDYAAPKDNGGETPTIALKDVPASPAIDSGVNTGAVESYYTALILNAPAADQRSETRDSEPDIGAYEFTDKAPVDFTDLESIVEFYESNFPEADYTAESWIDFAAALAEAKAIITSPDDYSDADVTAAVAALATTSDSLVRKVNKSSLQDFVDAADDMLLPGNVGKYIPKSVANLQAKLAAAKTVLNSATATQIEVDDASNALADAFPEMFEAGDKDALRSFVNLVGGVAGTSYTPASYESFTTALEAANVVLLNENAIKEDVETALTNLRNAFTALIRKADTAALSASVAQAQAIVAASSNYVAASLTGLEAALNAAIAVLSDPNAGQTEVNAARTTLNARIVAARLKADRSALLTALNTASAFDQSKYTPASLTALNAAIQNGANVMNALIDDVTQEQVDLAASAIYNAIYALKPVENAAPVVLTTDPSDEDSDTGDADDASGESDTDSTIDADGASNTSGTVATGTMSGASGDADASLTTTDVIDGLTEIAAGAEEAEVADMTPYSSPEIIADEDVPLSGVTGRDKAQGGFSAWWMAATLLAGLLAGAFVMYIVLKRLRRKGGASEAAGKN
jgi:hypothetical protein